MFSRRGFLGSAAVLAGAGAVSGRVQAARHSRRRRPRDTATMQPPLYPPAGRTTSRW